MRGRALMVAAAVAGLVAAGGGSSMGHHGWSGYDATQLLRLTGTIRDSGYEHPHGFIRLEVPGKVWMVVLAPPSRMENRGLPRAMLQPGKTAGVEGYPNRTDPVELRAERITIDGRTTELR